MIYLIKSAELLENNEFGLILKIGYTDDSSSNIRFGAYKNHNPTCQVLYTISNATKDQEDMIHAFFKRFRKYNREWYEYREEILDYFEIHKTKEDLDNTLMQDIYNLDPKLLPTRFRRKLQNNIKKAKSKEIQEYIDHNPDDVINEALIEFDKLTNFIDKMKFLCNINLNTQDLERFLLLIPQIFSNYYNTIGVDKIKSLLYQGSLLKAEYDRLINNQSINISDKIYEEFQMGFKYTKLDIKEKLREIFNKYNYKISPKASELENYFNLSPCQITNKETGKRDNGFLIVSKKDL